VLSGELALVAGGTGLVVLASMVGVFPLAQDGGPTPQRQLKVHAVLVAAPVVCCLPPVAVLLAGTLTGSAALRWAAVAVGAGWGLLLCRWLGRSAARRLETRGPELFALVRRPAS
jgi:ABC-2 type transport system permease protein